MSKPKFTPGPWVNNQGLIESELEHGWVNDGWRIAECFGPQAEINAHLIAAAPELYEACEAVIRYQKLAESDANTGLLMSYAEAYIKAEAALAKARGEG